MSPHPVVIEYQPRGKSLHFYVLVDGLGCHYFLFNLLLLVSQTKNLTEGDPIKACPKMCMRGWPVFIEIGISGQSDVNKRDAGFKFMLPNKYSAQLEQEQARSLSHKRRHFWAK
jgi:hypothetical protein